MTYKSLNLISLFIIAWFFVHTTASSQFFGLSSNNKSKEDYFRVDHAVFQAAEKDTGRLEVYYQIYNNALQFFEDPNGYKADYILLIRVYGDGDRIVDSVRTEQSVYIKNKTKITSTIDYRTNQNNFYLEKGKYEIKLYLIEPTSGESIEKKFKIKIEDQDYDKPKLSDIELVQAVVTKKEEASPFDKGAYSVIPAVTHRFGSQDNQKLLFYMEIYQGNDEEDSIRIETSLRHASKGLLYRDSMTTPLTQPINKQFREINMEMLRPGKYELKVELKGRRQKKIDVEYRDFELIWTAKGLITHDFKSVIRQIEIIADKSEVENMKNAETFEEKIASFNDFWQKNDPTPGTSENEFKNEFYRRISIANENFSYFDNNGWSTDRGRVFIRYGEPDQIDDYPIVPDRRPYQEWHYYRGNTYRKFVFVDVNEDGDYNLVYPYDGLNQRPDF